MATLVARTEFLSAAADRLRVAHTVLDIGPGIQPQTLVNAVVHICVEPYAPYAERILTDDPGLVVLNCTWSDAVGLFPPGAVDSVVLLDVIEHIEKDEGLRLLERTVGLARSQVVIMTPLGFLRQGEGEERDAWGMGGADWQVHRSGWTPDDFPGWEIIVCEGFHQEDAYGRPLPEPHGAFIAILDKGEGHQGRELHGHIQSVMRDAETLRSWYEESTSWRITKPLRQVRRWLHPG